MKNSVPSKDLRPMLIKLAALESPGDILKTHIPRPYPDLTKPDLLGGGTRDLYFHLTCGPGDCLLLALWGCPARGSDASTDGDYHIQLSAGELGSPMNLSSALGAEDLRAASVRQEKVHLLNFLLRTQCQAFV